MKDKKGKIRKNQNVLRNKVKINENLASGNALDIGRQYLMQGMSHTALEIWQTYIFHMFLFKRIQHLYSFIMYDIYYLLLQVQTLVINIIVLHWQVFHGNL